MTTPMPIAHRVRSLAVALSTLAAAPAAGAQFVAIVPSRCVDTLSAGALHRVPVYLTPTLLDTTARAAAPALQLFADDAAARLRRALIADSAALPPAPDGVRWPDVDGVGVEVMLRRDGTGEARTVDGGAPAAALLQRAARATIDSSGPFYWDEGIADGGLRFRVGLAHAGVDGEGIPRRLRAGFAVPVFTLRVPSIAPPRPLFVPRAVYPDSARRQSFVGRVALQFDVDSTGRPDMATAREYWPEGRPRPVGDELVRYREFVNAGLRALPRARFEPARAGGCPVRHPVLQTLEFQLR